MKEKLKNKKVVYTIIGIISVLLVTIGITYAYWLVTKTQTGENVISSGCLDITLDNEANDIALENQFPITDEEGMELTPYTFTVTNNCNTSVDYQIALESIETASDALGADSLKVVLNDNVPRKLYDYVGADTTIDGAYEAYIIGTGTLTSKDTEGSNITHNVRIWIDEDTTVSEMNKTFKSQVSVTVGQGITAQGSELASLIIEDAEINNYLYTETPDFSQSISDGKHGLYISVDDYGTSYYFRGNIENNYVKFGTWKEANEIKYKDNGPDEEYSTLEECLENEYGVRCRQEGNKIGDPMYWRIIRINGDGTIRLLYDGIEPLDNAVVVKSVAKAPFNKLTDSKLYFGYTYNLNGVEVDSSIKSVVDSWYNSNLKQDYGVYIADSIFCNDRKINFTVDQSYGTDEYYKDDSNPTLICSSKDYKYTTSKTRGNGLLSNPIGLLTMDEFVMSSDANTTYITNTYTESYSTMSPYVLGGGYAMMWTYDGYLSFGPGNSVRPVINIKADAKFTGSGTINDPYVIVTE